MNKLFVIAQLLLCLSAFVSAAEEAEEAFYVRGSRSLGICVIGQSGICGAIFGPIAAVGVMVLGWCGYKYAYRNREADETVGKIEAAGVQVRVNP